jgi:hypothetical protein
MDGWSRDIELGGGHYLSRTVDRDGELAGFIDVHPDARDPRQECCGAVPLEGTAGATAGHAWKLVSADPVTLAPSLLCPTCGNHGFVRDGQWVPA